MQRVVHHQNPSMRAVSDRSCIGHVLTHRVEESRVSVTRASHDKHILTACTTALRMLVLIHFDSWNVDRRRKAAWEACSVFSVALELVDNSLPVLVAVQRLLGALASHGEGTASEGWCCRLGTELLGQSGIECEGEGSDVSHVTAHLADV